MRIEYALVFLAFGAVTVTAEESQTSDLRELSKRSTPPPTFILKKQIDDVVKKTNIMLMTVQRNIESRMITEREELEDYYRDIKTSVMSNEAKEREKSQIEGKGDTKKIDRCVRDEQERFKNDLDTNLEDSIDCLKRMTKTAENQILKVRSTFFTESLYVSTYTEDMRNKWKKCRIGIGHNIPCTRAVANEIDARINLTRAVSEEKIKVGQDIDKKHEDDLKTCCDASEEYMTKRQEKREKTLKECIQND